LPIGSPVFTYPLYLVLRTALSGRELLPGRRCIGRLHRLAPWQRRVTTSCHAPQKIQHPGAHLVGTRLPISRRVHYVSAPRTRPEEAVCCRLGPWREPSFDHSRRLSRAACSLVRPAVDYREGPADGAHYFGASGLLYARNNGASKTPTVIFFLSL